MTPQEEFDKALKWYKRGACVCLPIMALGAIGELALALGWNGKI